MNLWAIVGILALSFVLGRATDTLLTHLKIIATKTKLGGFFLTSLITGFATTIPEFFIAVTASASGSPELALGNAIGTVIAMVSIIAGVAAIIGGGIAIRSKTYGTDIVHAFFAGLAPLFLLADNALSRVDGILLILLYGFYHYLVLKERNEEVTKTEGGVMGFLLSRIKGSNTGKHFFWVFLMVAVILFSADTSVRLAQSIAENAGISKLLVGIFVVALGTSLPELTVQAKAIKRGDAGLFVGNLLGSIVANGTLIIGISALIRPIEIAAFSDFLVATIFFLALFMLFYFFVKTKQRLSRWEGLMLVIVYAIFTMASLL